MSAEEWRREHPAAGRKYGSGGGMVYKVIIFSCVRDEIDDLICLYHMASTSTKELA